MSCYNISLINLLLRL